MENKKRLIDANALQRKICGAKCGCEYEDCGCEGDCQFDFFISNAPTVDAVEVVRCEDCRHFVQGETYDPCECMKWKVKFGVAYTEPDGYCHKAERKDNG